MEGSPLFYAKVADGGEFFYSSVRAAAEGEFFYPSARAGYGGGVFFIHE